MLYSLTFLFIALFRVSLWDCFMLKLRCYFLWVMMFLILGVSQRWRFFDLFLFWLFLFFEFLVVKFLFFLFCVEPGIVDFLVAEIKVNKFFSEPSPIEFQIKILGRVLSKLTVFLLDFVHLLWNSIQLLTNGLDISLNLLKLEIILLTEIRKYLLKVNWRMMLLGLVWRWVFGFMMVMRSSWKVLVKLFDRFFRSFHACSLAGIEWLRDKFIR